MDASVSVSVGKERVIISKGNVFVKQVSGTFLFSLSLCVIYNTFSKLVMQMYKFFLILQYVDTKYCIITNRA